MPSRVLPEDSWLRTGSGDSCQRTVSVTSQSHLLGPDAPVLEDVEEETMATAAPPSRFRRLRQQPSAEALQTLGEAERPVRATTAGEDWENDRKIVLSELVFKFDMFCKTTLYELLPISLAVALCSFLDGYQQARNRFGTFFFCMFLPVLDLACLSGASYFM